MKKILVVDDEETNRKLYQRMLGLKGHVVDTAENGIEALEILKNNNFNFDIVLTDIDMPKMDGFALISNIKNKKNVKVIFMTGLPEKHEKTRKAKFPKCKMLGKPFYAKELINLL